uniref:Uncharacterized protein n=1 Tax=Coccidioides posadasii RMSCC 3488 TaxID=454284 RepID=A0A0J6EXF3_COCPO|nr:hypothetical protein CPAG_01572 [Coccidioides posadasii RMSCC 3488]
MLMTGDTLLISLALMYAINGDQINDREANYGHPPLVKLNGKLECCGSPKSRCFRSAWAALIASLSHQPKCHSMGVNLSNRSYSSLGVSGFASVKSELLVLTPASQSQACRSSLCIMALASHIGRSFHYRPPKFTVAAPKGGYKHGYECDRDKMSPLLPRRANHLTYIPINPVVEAPKLCDLVLSPEHCLITESQALGGSEFGKALISVLISTP